MKSFDVSLVFGVFLAVSVETYVAGFYVSLVASRLIDSERGNHALC